MKSRKRQGVLDFEYVAEPDGDEVTAQGGLPLLVELMKRLGVEESAATLAIRERAAGYSEFQLVTTFVLLMAAGGDCVEDVRVLRDDKALSALVGHAFPSADTLLHTLETFHDDALIAARPADVKAFIPRENARLVALAGMMSKLVAAIAHNDPNPVHTATVDHDATIIEAHKQAALGHYKGGRGYQPSVAMWAETGLVLADEFRDGNVPAGMSNVPLIERAFAALPATITERFFRADSACYEHPVLDWLGEPSRKIGFAISADMSPELRRECVKAPAAAWSLHENRVDLRVDVADIEFVPGVVKKDTVPLRYIALRMTPKQGTLFVDGASVKYFAIVTNRKGNAGDIVDWHRQKAGTIEHVHDITKNELGAGVLPSGKFGANAAWYRLSLLTHNVLVALKRLALPPEFKNARPKRLRFRVFTLPTKVIAHARGLFARVAARLLDGFDALATRLKINALVPLGT